MRHVASGKSGAKSPALQKCLAPSLNYRPSTLNLPLVAPSRAKSRRVHPLPRKNYEFFVMICFHFDTPAVTKHLKHMLLRERPCVLLVDDDEALHILFDWALNKSHLDASVMHMESGELLMQYFEGRSESNNETQFPSPSVVFLDLKMPRVDGFDVLRWRQTRPDLQKIPFLVFTSSNLEQDRQRAQELGANAYLVKPMGATGIIDVLNSLVGLLRKKE
jgi:CheY-like chemotaxis protein